MSQAPSARAFAARVVARVLERGPTLEAALQAELGGGAAELAPTVRSLSYGAIRGFYRHEGFLARLLKQPPATLDAPVRALLSVALFELEDARTPDYAVVDAAVETARATRATRAAGLINAVLRRFLRERVALEAGIAQDPALQHAAPRWLAERLRADWPDAWVQVLADADRQAPLWLRVNARLATAAGYLETLRDAGIAAQLEPRVPQAVQLESPRDVAQLPGFAAGVVSVQDLGAQCVVFPLGLEPGQRVLDACAAPGGKTLLIAEREPHLAQLTAVDIDPARLALIRENLERVALSATLVRGDAAAPGAWWDGRPFDRILVDAPCSALGVIRRHPDIRLRRSSGDLDALPPLQRRLLESAWSMLAAGGRLVYCTCTLTRSENRAVIEGFLEATPGACIVPAALWRGWPGFGRDDGSGRQILPGEAGADGFYYAALTKR